MAHQHHAYMKSPYLMGPTRCNTCPPHQHAQMQMQTRTPMGCQHCTHGRQQNTVVISQPGMNGMNGMNGNGMMSMPEEVRDWTTGICGCFEHCGSCMAAFCCSICFPCYMAVKMDEACAGPLCCGDIFMAALRTRLRSVLGIQGSVCKDACTIVFCPCCAFSQMYREMKNVGVE